MRIDEKSRELLVKIHNLLSQQKMSVSAFPKQDIVDMVKCFYLDERERREAACESGIVYLEKVLEDAVKEQNVEVLLNALKVAVNEELEEWPRYFESWYMVKLYEKNAKAMYQKHGQAKQGDNAFCGQGVIYTVITGNYDVLQEPEYIDENYKYICFTDNPHLKSSVWEIRFMENPDNLDNVRWARRYKILCHQYLAEYDYSIYVDGKITIRGDMTEYIMKYSRGSTMLCFPHFVRECAYEEEKACAALGKDNAEIMAKQMAGYREEGYPENYGLIDSACLVRSHRDAVSQKVLSDWWDEVKNKSRRDQLSFGYVCWKNDFSYDISDLFIYDNPYIYGGGHRNQCAGVVCAKTEKRDDTIVEEEIPKTESTTETTALLKVVNSMIKEIDDLKRHIDALYSNYNVKKGWHLDINKEKINYELAKKETLGVTEEKRETEIIVSLTSYPARMYDIHYALYSLLHQSMKPDRIILWLSSEQFPNGEADLSDNVLNLKKLGLTIMWCENIGSYKKLIPAIREFPEAIIVTADDDLFYPENWLELLYRSYMENPDCVHCHRAHRVQITRNGFTAYDSWEKEIREEKASFMNFPTGCSGVLYPPGIFYRDIGRRDCFMELSRLGDDIWFWAMEVLNHTKIKVVKDGFRRPRYVNYAREIGLYNETTLGMKNVGTTTGNDVYLRNVLAHYPELLDILKEEIT